MSATADDTAGGKAEDTASTGKSTSRTAGSTASETTATPTAAQAAAQLKTTLSAADSDATQHIQRLGQVHQARLSQANRTVAALTARYGAGDARVKTAQASVSAVKATISRVSLLSQQLAAPPVQVTAKGWALQGRVFDAQLQPAARFTVFLVDEDKLFLEQYGFAYTDDTGYFLINYGGDAGKSQSASQLFVEIANTDADPVYLSPTAFQPVAGVASFQNIVLPAGGQPIGDPPPEIRAVALPSKDIKRKKGKTSSKSSKS